MNSIKTLALFAVVMLALASATQAHKKFFHGGQTHYQEPQHERCVCDCARPQPVLPNKPYYGSAGYAQPHPRPHGGGYGNAGSFAVAGSYGSGAGQTSGGY